MAVAVQKYIKNMAKSVTYTASDVLSTKFEYVKDFKNENQEVFKEVYSSVKDYRTTFARVKKTITNNKVMDAARVGFDSVMYSITTGDFYAKNKENEVIEKYGGNLMADLDIDDDDFDWEKEDLSTGDKVVATAIKKNSKIGTALTVEAISTTGKAQMDVSKENTMLLYTQNERLLNKLDGGFTNIMDFLKQNGEQTAKVQNKMNENLNKFMTNVDNNVAKLTKQMDELLEMQRNMYNPTKKDEKKKIGYDDIISRNGVINIKEYTKHVKKQGFNTLNDMSGGALSMLFGDAIEGSNLLATFSSTPFRAAMTTAVNKALGKKFDKAASELNTTLEGLVPSIIAKLNAASKKEDSGIMGFLGKIFGIKDGSKESINTNAYNKGAIPFDGITKRAITDVIPYYLRKMTSILTGEQEMVYDFSTGKWTSMRAVKANHQKTVNSANDGTADALVRILESNMGGRRLSNSFQKKSDYDRMMKTIESLAAKLQATGDYGSLTDLSSSELELKKMLDRAMRLDNEAGQDRRFKEVNGKKIDSGRGRSQISQINNIIRQQRISQNNSIKSINEGDSILRIIEAEGLSNINTKDYRGKGYVNKHGDFNQRYIQEMPMSQALVRAKDEYGITLYQYLRDMGASLRFIKANSIHLGSLGGKKNKKNKNRKISNDILTTSGGTGINYEEGKNKKYIDEYYKNLENEQQRKDADSWDRDIRNAKERARQKGKSYSLATTTDYKAEGDNVSLARIMAQAEMDTEAKAVTEYNKKQKEAEDKKWKRMASIIGEDRAKKLREASDKFEGDKSLNENMKKVKDESFSSKLMMFTKYAGNKLDKPGDVMADTILKVDYWLQKMLYGNDIKEEDTKKGFFQHMKETVEKGFQGLKDVISDAFGKLRDKITQSKAYQSIKKFFVGEKDDEGIYQGGLFGNFMGGMQRGLRKNAHDVKEYMKQQALAAKNKVKDSLGIEDTDTSSSNINPQPTLTRRQKDAIRRQQINDKLNAEAMSENSFIADTAREKIATISVYNRKQSSVNNEQYRGDTAREASKQAKIDELTTTIQNQKDSIKSTKKKIASLEEEIQKEKSKGRNKNKNVIKELEDELKHQKEVLEKTKKNRKKNKEILSKVINSKTNIKYMAVGGVNRTGKPFQSVLSAGEYLNGKLVPSTGIYTVPKGGVVVNPANASTRAKQATNERRYLNNIRRNAEANDKLTPIQESEEDTNKFAELMTNKDWRDLEDDKQRAEFLGSVASRGVIGGGLGLLVGGPLLGAAVGAASSLTKSTDAFSSMIFGSAVTENGKVQVDENGNIIRQDDGLISKEIMKAVPDIKKFGLGGAIAGLITPLGPLGGILAGSALGFAKNSEIFQGSLFGEGGVLSDENIKKLKKGAKNMGIGAIIGAFTGPFGLVGNALLGATAGYVTSTDKFKDAILGEKIDPNDPDSKRQGGVLGAVKAELKPLKDFGRNLVDKIMDEIFGKKEGDKRKGGIFGAIKENMVEPIISGTKSVFQSLQNKVSDLAHLLGDAYKKYRAKTAGNGFLPGLIEKADKVSGGLIHGAGSVFKAATKPFRLIGDDGLGGMLKAGRIKKGQETKMTARERLMFRGKHKMLADDNFSESDKFMADASANDLAFVQALLSYDDNKGDVDSAKTNSYSLLGQQLRGDLSASDSKKILKMLKNDDFGGAERFVRTRKISDEAKKNILKNIGLQKSKLSEYDKAYNELEKNGGDVQKILNERGFNVDVKDPKAMRYLKKQLNRELAHKESGLTDEEIEFDKKREFWNDTLKPISMPLETMVDLLKKIYNEDKLNNEYNRLTMEFDRLVAEGNDTEAEKVLNKAIDVQNKLNGVKTDIKTISDKHQEELSKQQPNPKSKLQQASEMKEVPERIKKVIQNGLKIFDIKIMRLLSDRNAIELDIDDWKNKNQDKELKGTITLTRLISFVKFNRTFEFEVNYKLDTSNNSIDINGVKQPESFEQAREDFGNQYVETMLPKEETGIWAKIPSMKLGDMVRSTIKMSGFFVVASIIPGGALAIGAIALAKKLKLGKKAKSLVSKAAVRVKHSLGSHEIDINSRGQKRKEKKYSAQAQKALDEAIRNNDSKLNTISLELYGDEYEHLHEEEKNAVNLEFMKRFKDEKRSKQITGHGLVGNIKKAAGTLKSGIKNSVAGGINWAKEKKLKAQEQETFLGKLFNKLDKWKLKKEKQDVEGKKDSRLAKILKWLFVGGIATPIVVGFVKEKLMPAIHEKIQPWLKKAGEKLIGVKNPQTGEYEGGLVSGIVNPIRNFFKDKFQIVSDWFHNTGKFSSPDSGFKGLINNFMGVFKYGVELWKSGANTIITEVLPGLVEAVVSKLPSILLSVGKGIVKGIASWFGKDDGTGKQALDKVDASMMISSNGSKQESSNSGTGIKFNNTVGGVFSVNAPAYTPARPNYNFAVNDVFASTSTTKNEDGTTTLTNDKTGNSVTSEFINDDEMVSAGVNESGTEIFYKRSDKNRTQPYSKGAEGEYVRMDKQAGVVLEKLNGNTSYNEMVARNEAMDAGVTNSYTGTTPILDSTINGVKILTKAGTSKANAKGLSLAIKGGGKLTKGVGKTVKGVTRLIPIAGVGTTGKIVDKGLNTLGNAIENRADKMSNRVFNSGQKIVNKGLEKSGTLQKINEFGIKIDDAWTDKFGTNSKKYDSLNRKFERLLASGNEEEAEKIMNQMIDLEDKMKKPSIFSKYKTKVTNSVKNSKVGKATSKVTNTVKNVKTKATDIVKNSKAGQTVSKVKGVADDAVKGVKSLFSKAKDTIINWFKDLFKGDAFKKALKEAGQESTEEAIEKMAKESGEKLVKECAEAGAEKIAKAAGKNAVATACDATGIGVVINIAMAISDFLIGMDDCRNILQIVDKDVPIGWRIFAGLANALQDIPIVGILFGIIGAKNIVWFLVDILGPIIMPGITKELREKQDQAQETLEEYNRENNTNLTLEQYNNKFNATIVSTVKGAVSDAGSFLAGRDATVSESMETRRHIESASDKVTKIREKLEDIASHMWEKQGSKFKKFNLTKETFGMLCAEVIDKIVILLNSLDNDKLEKVLDSAGDMRLNFAENAGKTILKIATFGAVDVDPFNDAWDDGYRGLEYLGLDEKKFENNSVVKCVGGIASVFVKSCGGAGLKPKIIDIVISVFCKGMAGDSIDDNSKAMIDESNTDISDINNAYTSKSSTVSNSNSTSTANDVIATNANANSKLSPINGLLNLLSPNKESMSITGAISNTIDRALSSITGGGFAGIGEVIESLRRKNTAINSSIDALKILPTDKEYWKIEVDERHPFASSLFKFTESISRVIKAPFSLAASMNASTAQLVSSGKSTTLNVSGNTGSSSSSDNNKRSSSSSDNNGGGFFSKIKKVTSKLWSGVKSLFGFGKGKGDSDSSDPFHIYQRDFNQSYNTAGDTEHQSVADSGCGPASAASILRMYGKEGSMNNAVNYALNNNYKEQNGGTYPSYFQDYLGKNGISTNPNASNTDVINSLANNRPVILMGQNKTGSKNTPYGNKYSHYVVARGFDKNGNVIVEDSEDKRGSTRYSLADTLRNTSVRITTGNGKYGRGEGDMSINERYITNVNKTISATVSSIIASALSGANIGSSSSSPSSPSSGNVNTKNTGNVSSTTSFSIDSDETIICGDSITHGLGSTSLGNRALGLCSGTTDKNNTTDAGSYETIFKDNSDVIAKAKNVIFFWGMNEVFTNQSTDAYFAQYQDSINTILGYGGKSTSDVNICILPVIWVPEGSGYGGMYNAAAVEAFNAKYIKPFAESKGYPLIDIYEDSKQVPHEAGDVHPSNYEKLYEIIKSHTSGGSGRGKSIINKNKKSKYGRSIWGRDGEDTTSTTNSTTTEPTSTTNTNNNSTSTTNTSSSSSNTSSSKASGLVSLLTDYSTRLTKGIFGNFYDALYGSQPENENNNGNNNTNITTGNINGDAKAAIGKTFTVTMDGVTKSLTMDESGAEIYTFLVDECGCNAAAAAGALGNWVQECGGGTIENIKPVALKGMITDGGGLMQWTAYEGVNPHTDTWIGEHPEYASDPWSWEAQLAHVKDELTDDKYWATWRLEAAADQMKSMGFKVVSGAAEYKTLTKPDEAAVNFERGLEGSADFWGSVASSEAYKNISYDNLYCFNRRLYAKIIYGLVTGEGSGSGRGKGIINKAISNNYKINKNTGRGIWGRDGQEQKTSTTTTDSSTTATNNTSTATQNTNSSSSSTNTGAKSIISKLSNYAHEGIKRVYGNFYDALYGSETTETNNNADASNNSSGNYTDGSGVIYAAAMVFEAMGRANPTFGYCYCGNRTFDLECRDGKKIDKVRPDCSGMMSAVAQYMGYYTYPGSSYTDTFFGLGYNVTNILEIGFCDKNGNKSSDWECIDFDPNDRRPGDMIVTNSLGHIDMYVFTDTNGNARGFNAGSGGAFPDGHCDSPGHGIENSYKFAKYYLDNGNQLPPNDGEIGAWTIQDGSGSDEAGSGSGAKVIRYKGSGSGRGKGYTDNKKSTSISNYKNSNKRDSTSDMPLSVQNRINRMNKELRRDEMILGRGNNLLKSLDEVRNNKVSSKSPTSSNSISTGYGSSKYVSGSNINNTIDLNQLIGLINVIANNSDKMDAVLKLLGTIAVNTENTSNAVTNNNKSTPSKNGLSALRNALDSNSSGIDIAKAVYQIAQS